MPTHHRANPLMAKRVQMNAILRNQKLAGADKDAFTQYFMQFFRREIAPLSGLRRPARTTSGAWARI